MRFVLVLLIAVLLCSCSTLKQNDSDVLKETMSNNSEFSQEKVNEEKPQKQAPEFTIIFPQNTYLGEKELNMEEWSIVVEGYQPLEYYPYGKESDKRISAGWIEIYEGQYLRTANGEPYIPWNHCLFFDYEMISGEHIYVCQVEFETYLGDVCEQYGVNRNDGLSYFWGIIFINPMVKEGTVSDWIFLNQRCFTKDDVLEIAKTYQPSW